MKTNVGSYDGAVRFVAGCVLLSLSHRTLGSWGLLGLIPILSAVCGFCPLYWILHLDTKAWELAHEHSHRSHVRKA